MLFRSIELLDYARVRGGAQIDDDLAALLVGVDVMEGEAGVSLEARGRLAGGAIHEREARAEFRLPAIVLDVRPSGQCQRQRIDDVRELGEHEVALCQSK